MERPVTERPAAGQAAADRPTAEPPATLTDDELQDVAAGADWDLYRWHHYWHDDDWLGWGDSHRGPF